MPHSTNDNTRRVSAHLFAGAPKIETEWTTPCGANNCVTDSRHALPPSYRTAPPQYEDFRIVAIGRHVHAYALSANIAPRNT